MFGSMRIVPWPMEFPSHQPFDTLISSKLQGEASGLGEGCIDVDIDVAIDHFAGKVEFLVGLDVEVSHKFHYKDLIAYILQNKNDYHIKISHYPKSYIIKNELSSTISSPASSTSALHSDKNNASKPHTQREAPTTMPRLLSLWGSMHL